MPEPERGDDDFDLDFGSGAAGGADDAEPVAEPPPVDAPPLVDEPTEAADATGVELSPPEDPLEAVSDFLDDFVDSGDSGDVGVGEGVDDPEDLEG